MGLLRNRNYVSLFIGQMISTYGNNLYALALPWYIYALTNSKLDLSIIGFADYLPAFAGLFVGVLVDRWRKRNVMLFSDIVRTILALGVFTITVFHGTFLMIFAVALLIQFFGAFFSPAAGAMTPLIISSEELPQAMGLSQSGNGVVRVFGMVSGGALMSLVQASGLFLIDAFTFVASVVSILIIRVKEEMVPRASQRGYGKEWREGFQMLIRSQTILQIFLGGLLTNFGLAPMTIVLTAWVKGTLHGSTTLYGVTIGCLLFGTIIGGLIFGRITRHICPKSILQVGLFILGCCTGLVGLWANIYWCASLLLIAGGAVSCLNGALEVILVKVVPQSMRGRLFGMFNGVMVLASPLGLLVFGTLMLILHLWLVWTVMGSMGVLGGLAYFIPVLDDIENIAGAQSIPNE